MLDLLILSYTYSVFYYIFTYLNCFIRPHNEMLALLQYNKLFHDIFSHTLLIMLAIGLITVNKNLWWIASSNVDAYLFIKASSSIISAPHMPFSCQMTWITKTEIGIASGELLCYVPFRENKDKLCNKKSIRVS